MVRWRSRGIDEDNIERKMEKREQQLKESKFSKILREERHTGTKEVVPTRIYTRYVATFVEQTSIKGCNLRCKENNTEANIGALHNAMKSESRRLCERRDDACRSINGVETQPFEVQHSASTVGQGPCQGQA